MHFKCIFRKIWPKKIEWNKHEKMEVPAELLRASRIALGMSQAELAQEAGVALRTVAKMETSGMVRWETLRKIQKALEAKGIRFLDRDEKNGFGLRLPSDWPKVPRD